MKIQDISFKGYDARPIRRLVARDIGEGQLFYNVVEEVAQIGKKEGFEVLVQTPTKIVNENYSQLMDSRKFPQKRYYPWCQDTITFAPNNTMQAVMLTTEQNRQLADYCGVNYTFRMQQLQGGNFFFIKEGNRDSLLIGREDLNHSCDIDVRKDFGISRIFKISQPDFHIDLGVRPLNNRRVLVNDPVLTIRKIDQALETIGKFLKEKTDPVLQKLQEELGVIKTVFIGTMDKSTEYGNFDKIQRELKSFGFKPIRVPGSLVIPKPSNPNDSEVAYLANFLNAIVHERADKSMVYITNDSMLDSFVGITPEIEKKIGFSFKKAFLDRIRDYIAPEDVHFINGDGYIPAHLQQTQGGVHCIFAEQV